MEGITLKEYVSIHAVDLIETLIKLTEYQENVKLDYKIRKKDLQVRSELANQIEISNLKISG